MKSPEEMFGKIMSISDELMWRWFELLKFYIRERNRIILKQQVDEGTNPRDIKFLLAEELVDRFHADRRGSFMQRSIFAKISKR